MSNEVYIVLAIPAAYIIIFCFILKLTKPVPGEIIISDRIESKYKDNNSDRNDPSTFHIRRIATLDDSVGHFTAFKYPWEQIIWEKVIVDPEFTQAN